MKTFDEWILDELRKREWTPATLAKKSGINAGSLSHILNGSRNPGPDSCIAIADAFGVPREEVFRVVGWLKPIPREEKTVKEIIYTVDQASPQLKEDILEYARFRLKKEKPDE